MHLGLTVSDGVDRDQLTDQNPSHGSQILDNLVPTSLVSRDLLTYIAEMGG